MNIKKILILGTLLSFSLPVLAQSAEIDAQTISSAPIRHYGDNPNIFHVFAYKAQQGVIHGIDKVDEFAEKGVAKIKPRVDRLWGSTESTASETIQQVNQDILKVTKQANEKIQETEEKLDEKPNQPTPIVSQPLSEISNTTQTIAPPQNSEQSSSAKSYAITDL